MSGKRIAYINQKGGVGKTTMCVQTAFELAKRGSKTLLIDLDSSGDATGTIFGEETIPDSVRKNGAASSVWLYKEDHMEIVPEPHSDNLHVLGGTESLANISDADMEGMFEAAVKIVNISKDYDYVVIDTKPSFSIHFLLAMIASKHVVIPTQADKLSVKATKRTVNRINKINKTMGQKIKITGIIRTKIPGSKTVESEIFTNELTELYGDLNFKTEIKRSQKIADAMVVEVPLSDTVSRYNPAMKQMNRFIDELIDRVNS